jgi:RNA polymerase sigma-70 factor (family 1)
MDDGSLKHFTDGQLADYIRAGDQSAFKELYNRYWKSLLDSAYKRLGSTESAEEVVQDIFVTLYLRRESLHITSSLDRYLKNALKYKVFDILRSKYVHSRYVDSILNQTGKVSQTPEHELQVKELRLKLDYAMEQLPERCKEVFQMSRSENLTNKEISEKLGISVSTVEKHISKAKLMLESHVREYRSGLYASLFFLLYK